MKHLIFILLMGCVLLPAAEARGQVEPGQWALTDALGRKAAVPEETSTQRPGKVVAMFYWTWHTDHHVKMPRVGNISRILEQYPEAAQQTDHPAWKTGSKTFFWEEPLFGYYRTTDKWVLRRHAEMLADAGVDVVFFDCTNGSHVWKSSYDALLSCWSEALRDGVRVPKVAFMQPFGPTPAARRSLRFLYEDIYRAGRYSELWFRWEGKPLIMAYDEMLSGEAESLDRQIRSFFTFRPGQPDYVDGPSNNRQWGWLEVYPQHRYGVREDGSCEQTTVGVAQNANDASGGHCYAFNAPGTYSRSYTRAGGHADNLDAYLYGLNFAEQWERARAIDPDVVLVTGWNEFIAGKHAAWPPSNPHRPFAFPDQYDRDRSRDIEPVAAWGNHADNYYCQLVQEVRRFKGTGAPEKASPARVFAPGDWDAWADVRPCYQHYRGNVFHRDHPGYADLRYVNRSGRNDIVAARVARDAENLRFYVQTDSLMTDPEQSPCWMMLFLDLDRDKSTGWEGYEFVINRLPAAKGICVLERSCSGWDWTRVAEVEYELSGNRLAIEIPRRLLGERAQGALDFEFKWNDNMQEPGNPMDFYVNGDTAPGGRFNFVYKSDN